LVALATLQVSGLPDYQVDEMVDRRITDIGTIVCEGSCIRSNGVGNVCIVSNESGQMMD
jgi:hypothetical protein